MIHYHGTLITPLSVATSVLTGRHAFVSYERPDQVGLVAKVCQSFAFDCGAYSVWRARQLGLEPAPELDVVGYARWVNPWRRHPGFDFALIPDVIDGDEDDQNRMVSEWRNCGGDLARDVPVWHMHESLERLAYLCRAYPRVALGSSGEWATVGTTAWWSRMADAMEHICDENGHPPCKLHGLRMLNPEIFKRLPLASADSTNVARNGERAAVNHRVSPAAGALITADRIERSQAADHWSRANVPYEAMAMDVLL